MVVNVPPKIINVYLYIVKNKIERGGTIMGIDNSKYFALKAAEELRQKQEREEKRRAFYEKITSSREEALKSLQEAGIYNERGRLAKEYK